MLSEVIAKLENKAIEAKDNVVTGVKVTSDIMELKAWKPADTILSVVTLGGWNPVTKIAARGGADIIISNMNKYEDYDD